jgi:hypothetical protein
MSRMEPYVCSVHVLIPNRNYPLSNWNSPNVWTYVMHTYDSTSLCSGHSLNS